MNQVAAKTETPKQEVATQAKKPSMIEMMAAEYSMDPLLFSNAVKRIAMPKDATNEEFAAFMMVAHEYGLNPFLRELYAFPKKGGGIVPMVSIDGWVNLINKQSLLGGFELETHFDGDKKLAAVTCRMYRKDRTIPVVITEYYIECFRNTDPWRQMPHRMLRHKALIQAARYAFGLSGIYDEDEAKDISGIKDITPAATERPKREDFVVPTKNTPPTTQAEPQQTPAETVDSETGEVHEYSAADAHGEGAQAKADGKSLADMPHNVKAFPNLAEAWTEGFNQEVDS